MPGSRKRLLVVFDKNAAGTTEMLTALRPLADLLFLVADTPEARASAPVLRAMRVETVDLPAGGTLADVPPEALRVDGVVTYSDRMVRLTAAIAERVGAPGHTVAAAELLTDKHEQRRRLAEAAVDDVPSVVVSTGGELVAAVERVGAPVVVKPVRGEGSRATFLLADAADAPAVLTAASREYGGDGAGPFVVERLLVGADYAPLGDFVSVELVASAGAVTVAGVTGKLPLLPPFRECAQLLPHGHDPATAQAAADLAVRAAKALDVTDGVLHVEVKLTPDGPRIIEVNGRLGGFVAELYRRATGVDLVAAAGLVALGEPVDVRAEEPGDVVLQWFDNPPFGAGRLVSVSGVPKARAHSAVDSYTTYMPAGSPCVESVGSQLLDMVGLRAPSHAEIGDVLDSVLRELSYTFEMRDGERITLRGDELRRRNLSATGNPWLPAPGGDRG